MIITIFSLVNVFLQIDLFVILKLLILAVFADFRVNSLELINGFFSFFLLGLKFLEHVLSDMSIGVFELIIPGSKPQQI